MKSIRIKQIGKSPLVFNTNKSLSEYLGIDKGEASHIISIKNEYEAFIKKHDIESIDYTDEVIIPQEYIDNGFKVIDIPGQKRYVANRDGVIINVCNGREIGKHNRNDIYVNVTLNKKRYTLHRIIATLFVPNPNMYQYINHINEDKSDNRADNLEWCDNSYNNSYGSLKDSWLKKGEKSNPIKVLCVKDGHATLCESIRKASAFTGAGCKEIRCCLKGKRKTANGFCYYYVNN